MTRSSVEADEVALEAWRSTIPCIYNAIENDDLVIIDGIPEDDSSDDEYIKGQVKPTIWEAEEGLAESINRSQRDMFGALALHLSRENP